MERDWLDKLEDALLPIVVVWILLLGTAGLIYVVCAVTTSQASVEEPASCGEMGGEK